MPQLGSHLSTVHKILYCSNSVNALRHPWGNFSAGETSPTIQVLCLYSFPGHSHTQWGWPCSVKLFHNSLPNPLFYLTRLWRTSYPCSLHSLTYSTQSQRQNKQPSHLLWITMPSPSGPQHGGHFLRSIQPWEKVMERGRCHTAILERPLASPRLHCPTWAPADWRLAVGEIKELMDAYSQWRTVTPGGGISSQVGGVSVSPQAGRQVVRRQL